MRFVILKAYFHDEPFDYQSVDIVLARFKRRLFLELKFVITSDSLVETTTYLGNILEICNTIWHDRICYAEIRFSGEITKSLNISLNLAITIAYFTDNRLFYLYRLN